MSKDELKRRRLNRLNVTPALLLDLATDAGEPIKSGNQRHSEDGASVVGAAQVASRVSAAQDVQQVKLVVGSDPNEIAVTCR